MLQGGQAVGNVHPSGRVDFVNAHRWVSEGRTAVAVASLGEALDLLPVSYTHLTLPTKA